MKNAHVKGLALSCLAGTGFVTGCASVNLSDGFLAADELRAMDLSALDARSDARESFGGASVSVPFPELRANVETTSRSSNDDSLETAGHQHRMLPDFVRNERGTKKLLAALHQSTNGAIEDAALESMGRTARNDINLNLSDDDLKSMTRMITREFLSSSGKANESAYQGNEFVNRVRTYWFAYFTSDDGFVSRTGAKMSPPSFTGEVGNDQILPVVAIFMEALTDQVLQVGYDDSYRAPYPVLKRGDGYAVGKRPTVSLFQENKLGQPIDISLVENDLAGRVSELEYKGIKFVSGLASENSTHLSGMLVRLFGDVEVAFVVGANFSFGDNETFAKLIDTIVQVSVRQTMEATAIWIAQEVLTDPADMDEREFAGSAASGVLDFRHLDPELRTLHLQ